MAAAVAAPVLGMGPAGWIIGGGILLGGILFAKKNHDDHNIGHIHDNHNQGNPNNRGPNGDPQFPYYYHDVKCKSKKDAFERALRDGHGNRPIFDGDHFHQSIMRGGIRYKFGNAHYRW